MILPIVLGSIGVIAAIVAVNSESAPSTPPCQPEPPLPTPPTPVALPQAPGDPVSREAASPREVMDAFIDEIADQSKASMAGPMASIARRTLTHHQPGWSSIVIPSDTRLHKALPSASFLRRIADTLGDTYEVGIAIYPARWTHSKLGSVEVSTIVFFDEQHPPPTPDEAMQPMEDTLRSMVGRGEFIEYGADEQFGLLDLILNTLVASSVGTVTSMGTQSLVRAAGGEQRLARLVRRYKRAKARGDIRHAKRMQKKITRSASRLKGRQVNWREVEQIIGEEL